ncbi:MAG: helix-turn-helix transcriptional regulator [Acidobacteria bacterium]|nr:helix-turn-helix transcriptional regulator [Acidobacteriota bacterium]
MPTCSASKIAKVKQPHRLELELREGFGKKILQARRVSQRTQREVADLTGLAVSYLSRLENNRMTPSIRTLARISDALGIPVTSFFDSRPILQSTDRSRAGSSGRFTLDRLYLSRRVSGRKAKAPVEGYSTQELEILQMCHFLLQHGHKEIVTSLFALINALVASATSKGAQRTVGL